MFSDSMRSYFPCIISHKYRFQCTRAHALIVLWSFFCLFCVFVFVVVVVVCLFVCFLTVYYLFVYSLKQVISFMSPSVEFIINKLPERRFFFFFFFEYSTIIVNSYED